MTPRTGCLVLTLVWVVVSTAVIGLFTDSKFSFWFFFPFMMYGLWQFMKYGSMAQIGIIAAGAAVGKTHEAIAVATGSKVKDHSEDEE